MAKHVGMCRKLIQALQEVMPNKFAIVDECLIPHECFRSVVAKFVHQAVNESHFAVEYAIVCQQIAEIFQPFAGDASKINQFKYDLTNQLQNYFISVR